MFDDLFKAKLIELLDIKLPKETSQVNDPNYCCYHHLIDHPLTKCFVFKDKVIELARHRKILLEEHKVFVNQITIMFGSLCCLIEVSSTPNNVLSVRKKVEKYLIKNVIEGDNEGWTLVTQKRTCK